MNRLRQNGFSLVELSIVLVILGLLTGGVLAGKSLIRASELRSVGTQLDGYTIAAFSFRDKYFGLPGDINNATSFWGSAGGTGSDTTCQDATTTNGTTCNGNGDGRIGDNAGNERGRFWQQLTNAGLIEGNYTGRLPQSSGTSQSGCSTGTSCPAMRLANTTAFPNYWIRTGSSDYGPAPGGNYFYVGSSTIPAWSTNDVPFGPILATEEAWNIDTKIDDGKPYSGKMIQFVSKGTSISWAPTLRDCTDSATFATANYDLARTGVSCSFIYRLTNG